MCTHNGEEFLRGQMDSILNQIYPPSIIYITDYASTDRTWDIILYYKNEYPNLIFAKRKTTALGAKLSFMEAISKFNEEVSSVDYDFLCFCDQDDIWNEHKLSSLKSAINNENEIPKFFGIFHDMHVGDENLNITSNTFYNKNIGFSLPRDLNWEQLIFANPVVGNTLTISKPVIQLLSKISPVHYMMHDWAAVLHITKLGRLCYLAKPLSIYRQHGSNELGAYRKRMTLKELYHKLISQANSVGDQINSFYKGLNDLGYRESQALNKNDKSFINSIEEGNIRKVYLQLGKLALLKGAVLKRKSIGGVLLVKGLFGF